MRVTNSLTGQIDIIKTALISPCGYKRGEPRKISHRRNTFKMFQKRVNTAQRLHNKPDSR